MRVAVVLGSSEGGMGRHVADLMPVLSGRGHDVTLAGPASTVQAHGLDGAGWTSDLAALPVLRRVSHDREVLHAHGVRVALLALASGSPWRRRPPLVLTWHNPPRGPPVLQQLAARAAVCNICVSADLVEHVRRLGGSATLLAAPAAARRVSADGPRLVRDELGLAPDALLLVAIARLDAQKGLDVLVRAAPLVATLLGGRRVVVAVAGTGPLGPSLTDLAARHRAELRLLGRRNDVGDLLAAADVVVLPSRWEGSSLLAQEAVRAGRPLVTTDVGGTAALVGDAALLVLPDDPRALAGAVAEVLTAPACRERLAAAARARVASWPHPAVVLGEIADLLEAVARRPERP